MSNILAWIKRNRSDLFSVASLIIGVLGFASGYLFYRASLSIPSLSLLDVGPQPRLLNISAVTDSPIRLVRRDGSSVSKNVFLARIYIWNSGNVILEHKAILAPLRIEAKNVEILDPKIGKVHRPEITGLKVAKIAANALSIDFALLEPEEGCSLNILYAAEQPTRFIMTGDVLGVKSFLASENVTKGAIVLKTLTGVLEFWGVIACIAFFFILIGALITVVEKAMLGSKKVVLLKMVRSAKWVFFSAFAGTLVYLSFIGVKNRVLSDPVNLVPSYLVPDLPPRIAAAPKATTD